ncbi:ABC transporter ATP-binding protein [Salinarimonas soli]|uniref:ABC transporter ATP-binding protein n=1 Tax=Salinarimonas soli TaxID=1638099 RepID=A0A5B2VIA1_9HYPH|nr:ABC transporter ATP-binding protein/permease [Salinarimonas soli]KAA2238230.1 ABC transporter ATP-binding protein [Salinarimonas soli]
MERNLFRYVWRHTRREQLTVLAVVVLSTPFYFASLDLPRRIVNEAILGTPFAASPAVTALALTIPLPGWLGGPIWLTDGVALSQSQLLFTLAGLYLALVVVNGAFKYWINLAKGVLGERMLRRMRYELFGFTLRFSPDSLRSVKGAEAATVVKDEVEPIGGFVGEAFIQPALLSVQALTALAFIFVQNLWLGLMTAGVIAAQFTVIPRLRRELLRLGRERQLESRQLAGRISETIESLELVRVHETAGWEQAEFSGRLHRLFDLRLRIYQRKFLVKFLNNFLAQVTPFLFFAVGGYLALQGTLNIGQLVAVIAAYRELPPPLKELIDWDQQRQDVQIKYEQVIAFFGPDRLLPARAPDDTDDPAEAPGTLSLRDLHVVDQTGALVIDGVTLDIALPAHVALVASDGPAASAFARMVGQRARPRDGSVLLDGVELADLPPLSGSRLVAYAGADPMLISGTLRDNLTYGLRRRVVRRLSRPGPDAARRLEEALRTGNATDTIDDEWVDASLAGLDSTDRLDETLVHLLRSLGFKKELFAFGLASTVDGRRWAGFPERIVEARHALREHLVERGQAHLVAPFDWERFNLHASLGENILFGAPTGPALAGRGLIDDPGVRRILVRTGLLDDLEVIGARLAAFMAGLFEGLPPSHALVERYSLLPADEIAEFKAMVARRDRGARLALDERLRLVALSLLYLEPRHRLGLLDDEIRHRVVEVRREVRALLAARPDPGVEFYENDAYVPAAPLKCNLLFGRVNQSVAEAQDVVTRLIEEVAAETGLVPDIERAGLDRQVGPNGRFLTPPQRAAVNLARVLIKRPAILVIDGSLAPFGENAAAAIRPLIRGMMADRTLIAVVPTAAAVKLPLALRFKGGSAVLETVEAPPVAQSPPLAAAQ